jgi:hypothetical protein
MNLWTLSAFIFAMFALGQIVECPEERGVGVFSVGNRNVVGIMTPSRGQLQVAVRQRRIRRKKVRDGARGFGV